MTTRTFFLVTSRPRRGASTPTKDRRKSYKPRYAAFISPRPIVRQVEFPGLGKGLTLDIHQTRAGLTRPVACCGRPAGVFGRLRFWLLGELTARVWRPPGCAYGGS